MWIHQKNCIRGRLCSGNGLSSVHRLDWPHLRLCVGGEEQHQHGHPSTKPSQAEQTRAWRHPTTTPPAAAAYHDIPKLFSLSFNGLFVSQELLAVSYHKPAARTLIQPLLTVVKESNYNYIYHCCLERSLPPTLTILAQNVTNLFLSILVHRSYYIILSSPLPLNLSVSEYCLQ